MKQREEKFMNTDAAAAFLGARAGTLAAWRFKNIGPSFLKIEGLIVYRRADLERYLRDRVVTTSRPVKPGHDRYLKQRQAMSA